MVAALPSPRIPAYGSGTLAELLPSALALVHPAADDPLGLRATFGERTKVCVLLVDGLGAALLDHHAAVAPTLAAMRAAPGARRIDTCVPATTVTSLTSLGTGLAPGVHGIVGYTLALREVGAVVNLIHFTRYGDEKGRSLLDRVVPETLQPNRTVFDRAVDAGIDAVAVTDRRFASSGLTRTAIRGPRFSGWDEPAQIPALVTEAMAASDRCLVYAYEPRLDYTAHGHGPDADATAAVLTAIDTVVAELRRRLPAGAVLLVTGDHGMVTVPEDARPDLDDDPALAAGVRALGGEPRFRHVYRRAKGAADDVAAAWTARLAGHAWVRSKADAIAEGWFGPTVRTAAAARIGDVVAAFDAPGGIYQRRVDPVIASLPGQHGSLTEAEAVVPVLVATG